MRCPTVQILAEYLDGRYASSKQQRLSAHIDECVRCRHEIATLQRTAQLLEAVPPPQMPADLWAGVAARLASGTQRAVFPRFWRTVTGVGLAASLLIGVYMTNRPQPSLPYASGTTAVYVSQHRLLSARDPLADRASLGVLLASEQGSQ